MDPYKFYIFKSLPNLLQFSVRVMYRSILDQHERQLKLLYNT